MNEKLEQQQLQLEIRYSQEELELLKSTLNGEPGRKLLTLLRNFFLQGWTNEVDRKQLEMFTAVNWLPLIKKTYLPEIDLKLPLGQLFDIWALMDTRTADVEAAAIEMESRQLLIDYLRQRFTALSNDCEDAKGDIKFTDLTYSKGKKPRQALIELHARNLILTGVENSTGQLFLIANRKEETPAQRLEREKRDSSK